MSPAAVIIPCYQLLIKAGPVSLSKCQWADHVDIFRIIYRIETRYFTHNNLMSIVHLLSYIPQIGLLFFLMISQSHLCAYNWEWTDYVDLFYTILLIKHYIPVNVNFFCNSFINHRRKNIYQFVQKSTDARVYGTCSSYSLITYRLHCEFLWTPAINFENKGNSTDPNGYLLLTRPALIDSR